MKLKEKLADDWVDGPESEIMDTLQAHRDSFLAGFEAARDLAAKAHLKSPRPFHCIEFELGEEDVECSPRK